MKPGTARQPRPFLKWAGGKRGVLDQLLPFFPDRFNTYHEPFLGGGALFFALHPRIKRKAYLSDTNEDLVNAYVVVRDVVEDLIDLLRWHRDRHSQEHYYETRGRHAEPDPVERAARLLYLNRTCFNGLYRVNRKGEFNVPFGRYANPRIVDEDNLRACSEALQIAEIRHCDFRHLSPTPGRGQYVYCDPPYDEAFNGYARNGFGGSLQEALRDCAQAWAARGARVVLSNSDTARTRALYAKDFEVHRVQAPRMLSRVGSDRKPVTELVVVPRSTA